MKSFKSVVCYRRFTNWSKPTGYDTNIKIYNCISQEKVPLIFRYKNVASWYTCGPTVYESSHIGHGMCYMKLDIIQRTLRKYFNINLVTVMNITDIDDKIIAQSKIMKKSCSVIANYYAKEFLEDLEYLEIEKPNKIVRVTENIPLILNFIDKLVNSKRAYQSSDGSVYFDVDVYKKTNNYTKLQNTVQNFEEVQTKFKKNPSDFALWKAAKDGEPQWESKYGKGRPGWHIECSAIAGSIFGSEIDIHAGGIDLRFPHHENEEAQCCAVYEKQQWVNYWIHTGHLHLNDSVKMSKSLKNTINLREFLQKYNPQVFRMACLMSHYSKNMVFSDELMVTAQHNLNSLKNFNNTCTLYLKGHLSSLIDQNLLLKCFEETMNSVHDSLCNDFDTASCLKSVNKLITKVNKMLHGTNASTNISSDLVLILAISNYINYIITVFGVKLNPDEQLSNEHNKQFNDVMDLLTDFRQELRIIGITTKDKSLLKLCDDVRDNVNKIGIKITDRGQTSSWSR